MAWDSEVGAPTGPQPRVPQPPAAVSTKLPHPATPPFFLKAHPRRWHCVDGEWLPLLGTLKVEPGVNGVDKDGGIDHAEITARQNGWVLIPWDVIPGTYIREWDCAGGLHYTTKWETPRHSGHRVLNSKIDDEGYRAFCRMLLEKRLIPMPDPDLIEELQIDLQEKRIDNLVHESHKPGVAKILEKEEARLAEMRTAADKLRGVEAEAAPTTEATGGRTPTAPDVEEPEDLGASIRRAELEGMGLPQLRKLAKQITGSGKGKNKAAVIDRVLEWEESHQ